ncbi:MAG TPA: hypothetical protein PLD27_06080 [bacterium]|nr:hypothetical protein [bacterium]HOL46872.1 hypothetical protein [bacterium]HPQ18779.1 hypothetical protein [bacterium]
MENKIILETINYKNYEIKIKALIFSSIIHIFIFLYIFIFYREPIINSLQELKIRLFTYKPIIDSNIDISQKVTKAISEKKEIRNEKINYQEKQKKEESSIQKENKLKFQKQENKKVEKSIKETKGYQEEAKKKEAEIQGMRKFDITELERKKIIPIISRPEIEVETVKSEEIVKNREELFNDIIIKEKPESQKPEKKVIKETTDNYTEHSGKEELYSLQTITGIKGKENEKLFIKDEPLSLDKFKYEKSSYEPIIAGSFKTRKILKNPDMPAPEWVEKKGISTYIVLYGIINEQGYLEKVEIEQMSPLYKLDVEAKEFVMKNWLWEKGETKQPVRIKLRVYLKK